MCFFDTSCKDIKPADPKCSHTVAYRGQLRNTLLYKYTIAQEQHNYTKEQKQKQGEVSPEIIIIIIIIIIMKIICFRKIA
jgi:hypothetical protein